MFVPNTFALALGMTILSTICWGSFANTYKFTRNYRFELYYWDYAAGIFVAALGLALTLGMIPGGDLSFRSNLLSAAPANVGFALAGGFIFNIANVLLLAGVEIAGLAIAFPISIGIALGEGVILSYIIQPKGSPWLLATGVMMAILAVILIGKAYGEIQKKDATVSRKGITLCVVSGLLMGGFAPFVARSMTATRPLTPYTVAVFFTLGAILCCLVFNVYLMKKPIVGQPLSIADYLNTRPSYHLLGFTGGIIWGIGTVFNFVAANFVGVAISYAIGQASPMIAALWGIFLWHEFRGANTRAKLYLAAMLTAYILALLLIALAYKVVQ